ncbi:50S ribosomal protein L21 [Lawsonia intracellularis]|uniref:Large ribosomal subunit protein bL21 n=2 Tax=Lawsonia intracellularis TaxID=29546 RepID=RL21_LAWIP|nr:50S ribosomal protein L21 [Lawsonia intracellularis]O87886.1 RecName: Full=Large ribosomal subunit protein bL21; AltName: Full=50S ribosomal protein L21 [Lawsonia intracellularis]Q1MQQ0.1 RecName: Full=Large ribosomal subunit protein bL21; AltName: Full=50S ribosomal protein L21 [Lawsonia intracellularis PHE/MN1-00]AAC36498.1 L21 50S ribosomal binding protein homolog [Lawsonia intracellularis]AGC50041.1 50S ribosomal protein L21 [Lawsonia intracellularis N343]KAA0204738.1 50S ribosomal prot
MYAIIEAGGKQFCVEEGSKIFVSKIDAEVGTEIFFDKIFMIGGSSPQIGTPYINNAKVIAKVLEHGRDKKILVFKKWRRNDSRKLQGHRQDYTALKVTGIQL